MGLGGAVVTTTTALRILSRPRKVHNHPSGEPDSKYDETSYFESGVLALPSINS